MAAPRKEVLKPSTFASYEDYARAYVVPAIGNVKVQELTAARLNAFYKHLLTAGRVKRAGGLAPKTVRNVHVMLHKALTEAVAWRLVVENVAEHAHPPRAPRRRPTVWTVEQLSAFLASVQADRFYALYLMSAHDWHASFGDVRLALGRSQPGRASSIGV